MRRILPLLVALALGLACGGDPVVEEAAVDGPVDGATDGATDEAPDTEESATADEAAEAPAPLREVNVELYFPAANASGLVGEYHEIFDTITPADRVKQIVADLIEGPRTDRALRSLPSQTLLRQAFVLEDGTCWLDFSSDLGATLGGGSHRELLAVYSIVDSIALNVREVRRVGILVNGQPIETLNGHVDLRRPLPPDNAWILGSVVARSTPRGDG